MDKYDLLEKQIDWKNLLIGNYKQLNLSEEEVMIILVCQYCLDHNENTITPDLLSIITTYDVNKCSKILTGLVNKSFIDFETDKYNKFVVTLKGIKRLLIDDFISRQDENDKNNNDNLLSLFEKEFGRPLSFAEVETIRSWIQEGYGEDKIKAALSKAVANNSKSVRYIDKILISFSQQEEVKKEGYTTISQNWRKDLKETFDALKDENK